MPLKSGNKTSFSTNVIKLHILFLKKCSYINLCVCCDLDESYMTLSVIVFVFFYWPSYMGFELVYCFPKLLRTSNFFALEKRKKKTFDPNPIPLFLHLNRVFFLISIPFKFIKQLLISFYICLFRFLINSIIFVIIESHVFKQ